MIYGASRLFKGCSEKDKLAMVLLSGKHGPKVLSDVGANSLFMNYLRIGRHKKIHCNGEQRHFDLGP